MSQTTAAAARFSFSLGKLFIATALVAMPLAAQQNYEFDANDRTFLGAWYLATVVTICLARRKGRYGVLAATIVAGVVCLACDVVLICWHFGRLNISEIYFSTPLDESHLYPALTLSLSGAFAAGTAALALAIAARNPARSGIVVATVAAIVVVGGWCWEQVGWRERRAWSAHTITTLTQFTADSRSLVTSGLDWVSDSPGVRRHWQPCVKFWEISTGKLIRSIDVPSGALDFALSPEQRWLAFSGDVVSIYDVASGELVSKLDVNSTKLAFTADSRRLVAMSPTDIQVCDTTTWTVEADKGFRAAPPKSFINRSAFSPDGELLAASMENNKLRVWSISERREMQLAPIPKSVSSAASDPPRFSTDSRCLFRGQHLWRMSEGERIEFDRAPEALASADGLGVSQTYERIGLGLQRLPPSFFPHPLFQKIFDVYAVCRLTAWRADRSQPAITSRTTSPMSEISISPDGRCIVTKDTNNGAVRLWDVPEKLATPPAEQPAQPSK